MLDSLEVRDFQNHRRKRVKLLPGVNCLVGDNGAGKSALMRALIWLFTNSPSGDWMIRHGQEKASVRAVIDGHELVRSKGGRNLYKLDGKRYVSFGTTVPEPIANLVNITSLNIQSQIDPPFWFADTAGKVSRELNAVVDLDVIDSALTHAVSAVRRANQMVELLATQQNDSAKASKALDWVSGASEAFARLSEAYTRSVELSTEVDALESIIEQVDTYVQREQTLTELVERSRPLTSAYEVARGLWRDCRAIEALVGEIEAVEQSAGVYDALSTFGVAVGEARALALQVGKLDDLIDNITEQEQLQCQAQSTATRLREKLAKDSNGLCPLCGQTTSRS